MSDRDKMQGEGASEVCAFLGKGTRVTGKLAFDGPGRIEGHVEGEVSAQDSLVIGESAVVNANINGTSIIVHGKVTGDIVARARLELRAPSKVIGNITAASLIIQDGAMFEGNCSMSASELAPNKDRTGPSVIKGERPPLTTASEAAR
jgi:cytoskeletal protein CcmA (bactofilin family)